MKILEFLNFLYPPTSTPSNGWFTLWEIPGKASKYFDVSQPGWREAVAAQAQEWDQQKHNVFFGLGLRGSDLGPYHRGKKKDIVAIPGLWVDIDIQGPGHKGTNYPTGVAAIAEKILIPFGVEPSRVVLSGGGLHVYWAFDQPLTITDENRAEVTALSKAWQARLIAHAAAAGWGMDDTADLTRVLRPVGTNNHKTDTPRPVEFIGIPGPRYSYTVLRGHIEKLSSVAVAAAPTPPPTVPEPEELTVNEILDLAREKLKRSKHPERKSIIKAVLAGQPFAGVGERDRTLQKIASWIAFGDCDSDPEVLAELLRPSLEAMEEESPEDFLTVEDAVKKISRAQDDARQRQTEEAERNARFAAAIVGARPVNNESNSPAKQLAALIKETAKETATTGTVPSQQVGTSTFPLSELPEGEKSETALAIVPPDTLPTPVNYTADSPLALAGRDYYRPEELGEFIREQAALAGAPIPLPVWRRRWIIQSGEYFYVFGNGSYQKAIQRGELEVSLPRDLAALPNEYFSWDVMKADEKGWRPKTTKEIISELGTVARTVVASMRVKKTYYDANTQTLYEVACPLRELKPEFSEEIDRWLSLLGGESAGKLKDWLATITDLTRPSCGLMITGVTGAGKSMLALGCSRLWSLEGPTKMDEVFADFNADLQKCPLVVADETLPEGHTGKPISTKKLRDLIASDQRPLHRKFQPNATLVGAVRAMFLANNDDMLRLGDENLGPEALAAVAGRFLHIVAGKEAAEYLKTFGGREGTKEWIDSDLIAKHVLWLKENRAVVPGNRFLVEGQISKMHQKLAVQGTVPGLVTEFLARYLAKPSDFKTLAANRSILIHDGQVFVNAAGMLGSWARLISGDRAAPTLQNVNRALANLSETPEQVRKQTPDGYRRYWRINIGLVLRWAEDNGIGDSEEMLSRIRSAQTLETVPAKETKAAAPVIPLDPPKPKEQSTQDQLVALLGKDADAN